MKLIKTLYEKSLTDRKCKLNRLNKSIDPSVIYEIENNGVTCEFLDTINAPVFKYGTQITIHGLFPAIENGLYIGGYKSIIQNKNLSIGVKYNAIDAEKKARIYGYLSEIGFKVRQNSSEYFAYISSPYFSNIEDYEKYKKELTDKISGFDENSFFGYKGVQLYQYPMVGYFLIAQIEIFSIYEKNIETFLFSGTGKNVSDFDALKIKRLEAERIQRIEMEAKWVKEREQANEKKCENEKVQISQLEAEGYRLENFIPITDGLTVLSYSTDWNGLPKFQAVKYKIVKGKKKTRYYSSEHESINEAIKRVNEAYNSTYSSCESLTSNTTTKGYIK